LNRRKRACVLAGGEPFLYFEFGRLIKLLNRDYSTWIYSNLEADPSPLIENAEKPYPILGSLHPWADFDQWYKNVQALWKAGHFIKFHIVKSGDYQKVLDFLAEKKITGHYNTHLCGDQNSGIRSRGKEVNKYHDQAICANRIFLFGPDGNRYPCVKKMGDLDQHVRGENIMEVDRGNWMANTCNDFGYCTGCDNNIEGMVIDGNACSI
jgi:hypothetical protein